MISSFLKISFLGALVLSLPKAHAWVENQINKQVNTNGTQENTSSRCVVFQFDGLSQQQLDMLVDLIKNKDAKLPKRDEIPEKKEDEQEAKQGESESSVWWMEDVSNLKPIRISPIAVVYASSSTGRVQGYILNWKSSIVDPFPRIVLDLKKTCKIYYIEARHDGNSYKNFKIYYGDNERTNPLDIMKEKLFALYVEGTSMRGIQYFKPPNSLYVEGRYIYITKFPNEAYLNVISLSVYGVC